MDTTLAETIGLGQREEGRLRGEVREGGREGDDRLGASLRARDSLERLIITSV